MSEHDVKAGKVDEAEEVFDVIFPSGDQAGESTFPEFLASTWRAGVVRYDVDLAARTVAYYGCNGEEYVEEYPAVDID